MTELESSSNNNSTRARINALKRSDQHNVNDNGTDNGNGGSFRVTTGNTKVDLFVAALTKTAPKLPLREEQLVLGVETILAELSSSNSISGSFDTAELVALTPTVERRDDLEHHKSTTENNRNHSIRTHQAEERTAPEAVLGLPQLHQPAVPFPPVNKNKDAVRDATNPYSTWNTTTPTNAVDHASQQQQQLILVPLKNSIYSNSNNVKSTKPTQPSALNGCTSKGDIREHKCAVSYIQSLADLCDGPTSKRMDWKEKTACCNSDAGIATKQCCFMCKGTAYSSESPLFHGCGCASSRGVGHIECYVKLARSKTLAKQNKMKSVGGGGDNTTNTNTNTCMIAHWIRCSKCKKCYTGDVQTGLAYGFYKHGGQASVRKSLDAALQRGKAAVQAHQFADACEFLMAALALCRLQYSERSFCCDVDSEPCTVAFLLAATLSRAKRHQEAMNVLAMLRKLVLEFHTSDNTNTEGDTNSPTISKINVYAINIIATAGHLDQALMLAEEDCQRHLQVVASKSNSSLKTQQQQLQNQQERELCVMATLNYARLLLKHGDRDKGAHKIEEAYNLAKKLMGPEHYVTTMCHTMLKWTNPSSIFDLSSRMAPKPTAAATATTPKNSPTVPTPTAPATAAATATTPKNFRTVPTPSAAATTTTQKKIDKHSWFMSYMGWD
jgi:hypothetical protein